MQNLLKLFSCYLPYDLKIYICIYITNWNITRCTFQLLPHKLVKFFNEVSISKLSACLQCNVLIFWSYMSLDMNHGLSDIFIVKFFFLIVNLYLSVMLEKQALEKTQRVSIILPHFLWENGYLPLIYKLYSKRPMFWNYLAKCHCIWNLILTKLSYMYIFKWNSTLLMSSFT